MTTAIGSYATGSAFKSRAGITDSTDDTLIASICDQVNSFIENTTGRIIAPITGTPALVYDGTGENRLYLPVTQDATYARVGGVRSISTLEIAQYTGAAYETVAVGDYFLRAQHMPGAPFDWLYLSDRPAGSYYTFPKGFATVRVTALAGWAAIPDEITDLALTLAIRLWHARESGQQDVTGTTEMGDRIVSRFISGRDRDTLRRYTLTGSLA